MIDPIRPFLKRQQALILDGGLATHLEALGCDLNDSLWSARLLIENPDIIRQAHLDYLWAGADCIISASYQATIQGFATYGLSEAEAIAHLKLSVTLAQEARQAYWQAAGEKNGRLFPLVAASIGPYGAFLADGSEYSGDYGLSQAELADWHRQRWRVLAHSGADLLACETIPSLPEALAYLDLLAETPETAVWLAFSCRNEAEIWDGTAVSECITATATHPQVVALGINCTAPRYVPQLIKTIQQHTTKPIIVYPNSGEQYEVENKQWLGQSIPAEFGTFSKEWRKLGAGLIGGCCRTTPAHIRQIRDRFR